MIISLSNYEKNIRNNFLNSKLSLQSRNYPFDETNFFVAAYYGLIRNIVSNNIEKDSILMSVPSSTSTNTLTAHLGNFISQDIPGSTFIDSNSTFISTNLAPSKNKISFIERVNDPIFFEPISKQSIENLNSVIQGKPIYLVEDWFSTGETSINFKRELEKYDHKINGITALIVNTKYLAKPIDIIPLKPKLSPFSSKSDKELSKTLIANFDGFSKYKITRLIFELSKEKDIPKLVDSLFIMKDKYISQKLITEEGLEKKYLSLKKDMDQSLSK